MGAHQVNSKSTDAAKSFFNTFSDYQVFLNQDSKWQGKKRVTLNLKNKACSLYVEGRRENELLNFTAMDLLRVVVVKSAQDRYIYQVCIALLLTGGGWCSVIAPFPCVKCITVQFSECYSLLTSIYIIKI